MYQLIIMMEGDARISLRWSWGSMYLPPHFTECCRLSF